MLGDMRFRSLESNSFPLVLCPRESDEPLKERTFKSLIQIFEGLHTLFMVSPKVNRLQRVGDGGVRRDATEYQRDALRAEQPVDSCERFCGRHVQASNQSKVDDEEPNGMSLPCCLVEKLADGLFDVSDGSEEQET